MNKSSYWLLTIPLFLASCIQPEQENTECDIEAVSLHLENPSDFFFHDYDTLMTVPVTEDVVYDIVFKIKAEAEMQCVPTSFRITDKASLYKIAEDDTETPFLNGSLVDFSNEQVHRFRVVSEDKVWSRNYTLSVGHEPPCEGYMSFDFESYSLDPSGKYYVWEGPKFFNDEEWKNGNPGFKLSRSSAKPMEYPTTPVAGGGPDGSACVKLETCDTGQFGKMVNMRLASGSMFNGVFDISNALKDALKATLLGSPYTYKPTQLRAWLRYEPGNVFQNRDGSKMDGVIDEPDMYIVFYRNEDEYGNKIQIDGNDVLTSPHIVGLGRLPHHFNEDGSDKLTDNPIHGVTAEWQEFRIPVEYRAEVDPDILEARGYSLIIGSASSWQGAFFKGAVGSKFFIDKMQLFCDEKETEQETPQI